MGTEVHHFSTNPIEIYLCFGMKDMMECSQIRTCMCMAKYPPGLFVYVSMCMMQYIVRVYV